MDLDLLKWSSTNQILNLKENKMSKKNITMYDEFEFRGYWFIPSKPDERIAGILKFSMDGIDLELFGAFGDDPFGIEENNFDIVLGDCEEEITLLNGFQTKFNMSRLISSEYTFNKMIVGEHFSNIDDIQFDSLSVNFSYIEEWMSYNPFDDVREFDSENKTKITKIGTSYSFPPVFTTDIPSIQAKIKADYRFNTRGERYKSKTIQHSGFLSISPYEKQSLDWYLNKVGSLQDFLSLIIDFPIFPLRMNTKGDVIYEEHNIRKSLSIFILPMSEYLERKFKPSDIFIKLPQIESLIEELLIKWFDNEKNPALRLYLDNIYSNANNFSLLFVNYTKALESFHRITSGHNSKYVNDEDYEEIKEGIINSLPADINKELKNSIENSLKYSHNFGFRRRIKELTRQIDEKTLKIILGEVKVNSFSNLVVDNRNYYTHYDQKSDNILTDWGLASLNSKTKVIMLYHLLKMIGINDEDFYEAIVNSKMYSLLSRNL